MTLDTMIILAGAAVAVLPFLGFPSSWDKVIFLILGILVLGLGIALRRRGNAPAAPHINVPEKSSFGEVTHDKGL